MLPYCRLNPISNRFSRCFHCLDHCFGSFWSPFETIFNQLQNTAVLEPNYFVFEKHVIKRTSHTNNPYTCASRVCTLEVRFLLSPIPIVSVSFWITVFARLDRFLNLLNQLQNAAVLEPNYFVFETFYVFHFFASLQNLPQALFEFSIRHYEVHTQKLCAYFKAI